MYENPIDKIYGEIQTELIKQDEEHLMYLVSKAIGYKVDKDELLKALQYDRNQYQKGYNDAKSEYYKIGHWIEHEKSISTGFKHLRECSCCKCYFDWLMPRNSFCPNCGADMRGEDKE